MENPGIKSWRQGPGNVRGAALRLIDSKCAFHIMTSAPMMPEPALRTLFERVLHGGCHEVILALVFLTWKYAARRHRSGRFFQPVQEV